MGVCPSRGIVKNDQRTDKSWEMEESMTWNSAGNMDRDKFK
jgi:hypothetical protein